MRAELVAGFAIIAGFFVLGIRIGTRVNRHVAPMLESPGQTWDPWKGAALLDGHWNQIAVRIRSYYMRPTALSVTMRVPTGPPDLEAFKGRRRTIEFQSIRKDRIGRRLLARVGEDELSKPGPRNRAAIGEYFTPARVVHLSVLLRVLEWHRFQRSEEGICVWRSPAPLRWNAEQTRNYVQATLLELQGMA